jgi:glycosyltransferase involved in cell wall biosynthesis
VSDCSSPETPLISVIIPAYNAAAVLPQTLATVLAQTHRHLEVLIVDDGSTDDTVAIAQAVANGDPRVQILQQANGGVAAARNAAIAQAQGTFIAPIDADDLWHPQTLENLLAAMVQAGERAGVAYAWSVDIDQYSQPTGQFRAATVSGAVLATLICHNFIGNASATLIRRRDLQRIGGYDPHLRAQQAQGCEDWDLYLRLAECCDFCVAPQFLIGYRKTVGSMSGDFNQMARSHQLILQRVRDKHPDLAGWLYRLSASSLYVYFAQQSFQYGLPRASLDWIRRAIALDPAMTLGRLGVYRLALLSWLQHKGLLSPMVCVPPENLKSDRPSSDLDATLDSIFAAAPVQSFRLRFKLLVGTSLHWLLSRI